MTRRARGGAAKELSAMMRVRNEAEFLAPAVASIADLVEEIVLVDNRSDDATPRLFEQLRREHAGKVRTFVYPHAIRRVGRENWEYAADPAKRDAPTMSATYYNWCKARCGRAYVLNWDGDMIATDLFRDKVRAWRASDVEVVFCRGANVHADRAHLAAAISGDREAMLARLSVPGLPRWATVMTRDSPEARIYPKRDSRFVTDRLWTQRITTPWIDDNPGRARVREADGVDYLHMKLCKRDPFSNYSDELARELASNVTVGPPLEPAHRALLDRFGLGPRAAAASSPA